MIHKYTTVIFRLNSFGYLSTDARLKGNDKQRFEKYFLGLVLNGFVNKLAKFAYAWLGSRFNFYMITNFYDVQPQYSFLQSVFNDISLERDPKLWQSANDILVEKRIRFLSQFPQTRFESQLGKERPQLQKNEPLSKAFKAKGIFSDHKKT